jgi:glutamate-1-semialdehyde 2,1-aminomutase
MEKVAPLGPVYQAGTLSGNPVAVSAALAMLERLDGGVYDKLEMLGARLEAGLSASLKKHGIAGCVQRVGSMLTLFFTPGPVRAFGDAVKSDTARFGRFHQGLIARGQYWPPSQFEAAFISAAHTEADIDKTIADADAALAASA